jgi:hypothetical protein
MIRKILATIFSAVMAVLISSVPIMADDVQASFTLQTQATVNVTHTDANGMDPFTEEQVVTVNVDMGTGVLLSSLDTVILKAYLDSDASTNLAEYNTKSANTQTCAVVTWTSGGSFVLDAGAGTSWALGTCNAPALTTQSGDFIFRFTPGKVATETSSGAPLWQMTATATDSGLVGFDADEGGAEMNLYTQVNAPDSITWGAVTAGLAFADSDPSREALGSTNVISNGNYSLRINSGASTWGNGSTLSTDGTPAANEFGLKADDDNTVAGAIDVSTSPQPVYTGTITGEAGASITTVNIWLAINATFPSGNFSGVIAVTAG